MSVNYVANLNSCCYEAVFDVTMETQSSCMV